MDHESRSIWDQQRVIRLAKLAMLDRPGISRDIPRPAVVSGLLPGVVAASHRGPVAARDPGGLRRSPRHRPRGLARPAGLAAPGAKAWETAAALADWRARDECLGVARPGPRRGIRLGLAGLDGRADAPAHRPLPRPTRREHGRHRRARRVERARRPLPRVALGGRDRRLEAPRGVPGPPVPRRVSGQPRTDPGQGPLLDGLPRATTRPRHPLRRAQ